MLIVCRQHGKKIPSPLSHSLHYWLAQITQCKQEKKERKKSQKEKGGEKGKIITIISSSSPSVATGHLALRRSFPTAIGNPRKQGEKERKGEEREKVSSYLVHNYISFFSIYSHCPLKTPMNSPNNLSDSSLQLKVACR